jgi:inner membrane protein
VSLYEPARFAGQVLRLHYARAQDLGRYLGMVAAEGELFVQFWMQPGDPPLELVIEDQGDVDVIPAALRRFL